MENILNIWVNFIIDSHGIENEIYDYKMSLCSKIEIELKTRCSRFLLLLSRISKMYLQTGE